MNDAAGSILVCGRWPRVEKTSNLSVKNRLAPLKSAESLVGSCSGGVVDFAPQPAATGCEATGFRTRDLLRIHHGTCSIRL